jgi:inositol 2-dehydrogenase
MQRLRIAIVGVGRMGLTHAENLVHRISRAELVAVTTSNPQRAEEVQKSCGPVTVYPDLDTMLEKAKIDAVVIASSTGAHAANVEKCAAAGLQIFCEKPLALNLPDCDRAIAAAEKAGVKLMIAHMRRFDSGYAEARRVIQAGEIGKPLIFRGFSGDTEPPPPSFADLKVSGGLMMDSMIHDIDMSRWLMDDEILRVYTEADALVDAGVAQVRDVDNAVVVARFRQGMLGNYVASRLTRYGHDLRVEVLGEEGCVQVGRLRKTPLVVYTRKGAAHDTMRTTPDRFQDAFVNELEAFIDCVIDDTKPPVTGYDSRAAVAVALAARRSHEEKKPVNIADMV